MERLFWVCLNLFLYEGYCSLDPTGNKLDLVYTFLSLSDPPKTPHDALVVMNKGLWFILIETPRKIFNDGLFKDMVRLVSQHI